MKKIFDIFFESIFWLALFASPFLSTLLIAVIVYCENEKLLWLSLVIATAGLFSGIFLAERIRKKYGCMNYISKLFS